MNIERQSFGVTPDGEEFDLYTLTNKEGMSVGITNYGGIITSLMVPDRDGRPGDIVLGYAGAEGYLENPVYFGCIVGRYANRIRNGRFVLDGVPHQVSTNVGQTHLHGGYRGFDKMVWQAVATSGDKGGVLELNYLSSDGEEGYPGTLSVCVIYTLTVNHALQIDYRAETDRTTIINLSNHTYFNLAGTGDILGHEIMLQADRFTPMNSDLLPTGEVRSVEDTPMDFRTSAVIGDRITSDYRQLAIAGGFDHNFVLPPANGKPTLAARVQEPVSGRILEVHTTQPGVQFYTGNFLDGSIIGKGGTPYQKRSGLCLETQHFPDSPNQPTFPSTRLEPGQFYQHTTVFSFPRPV
ncbi:galactose mutarotase [bacterium]|nr:galactose mutarotase [bacterium]